MSKYLCIVALILLLGMIVSPAAALVQNVSANQAFNASGIVPLSVSVIHDTNYLRFEIEVLIIAIGLICLAISRIWERAEDIFSIAAVVPFGVAAWYANFMTFEYLELDCDMLHVEMITPSAGLSIVCIVLFLMAIINVIWIFFLQKADKKLEGGNY